MVVEILFNEVCNNYGDGQNVKYLQATLPDAQFVFTSLLDEPYFVNSQPDMLYIGAMSENTQRQVIEKLLPFKARITELVEAGIPILATGNSGEIFCSRIDYVTEQLSINGLGIFDLNVKTDWFNRYHAKILGKMGDIPIVGFRAQFSFLYGDNTNNHFITCDRGIGINPNSKLEGWRKNNLICTQIIGPILPLNPLFCEYFIGLTGTEVCAAYRDEAMHAYQQRLKEFSDPTTVF